jgi:hypothetical protein
MSFDYRYGRDESMDSCHTIGPLHPHPEKGALLMKIGESNGDATCVQL